MNLRALAISLAALVSLAALAAAQDPSGSSGPGDGGSGTTTSESKASTSKAPATSESKTSTRPAPPPCAAGPPCSDPKYRECAARAGTEEARRACADDYCARGDDPARRDWCARLCAEDPGRPPCRSSSGPGSGDVPPGARPCLAAASSAGSGSDESRRERCIRDYCASHAEECKAFCRDHPNARFCTFKPRGDERHIAFEPMADGHGLLRLTVDGVLVLESVRMEVPGGAEFSSERSKNALVVKAGANVLELHDDAAGFLRFEGRDAAVTLVLPEGARVEAGPAGHRALIDYGGRATGILEGRNLTWLDGRTATATLFFSFHVANGHGPPGPVRDKVKDALRHGDKVGAEVHVERGDASEILAYDQVRVRLRPPRSVPTPDDPLRITLSSDLPEGRTIVLHVNRTVLDVEAGQVRLRYFDLPEGENGTARTEVLFRPASDLDDILDPADDAGQPEYYVVRDQHGLQVLVSVPHWSVHMVELSGLAEILQPSVLVGVVVGAGAVAVAAVALFVPRRRQD